MALVIPGGDSRNGGRQSRDALRVSELERLKFTGDAAELVFRLAADRSESGIDGLCQGSHCNAPETPRHYRDIILRESLPKSLAVCDQGHILTIVTSDLGPLSGEVLTSPSLKLSIG